MQAESEQFIKGVTEDTPKTITRHAAKFFSGTLLSRITGFFRDVVMASAFGAEPAIAGFMVAFRLAHLLRRLVGEGALQPIFVPHFENLRKHDSQLAANYFKDLAATLIFSLVLFVLLFDTSLLLWLRFCSLTPENLQIGYFTALQFPSLIFISLYGLNQAFLQCQQRYFIPSVAPALFNIVWIGVALMIQRFPPQKAMAYLSVGIVAAFALQWLMTYFPAKKQLKILVTSHHRPKLYSQEVKKMIKPMTLGLLGVGASQINNAIDTLFSRYADVQGPAYLWYALRIQQLPLALFGIAIAGAFLPSLSRAAKSQDWQKYREFLSLGLLKITSLMLPATFYLIIFSRSLITLFFHHGEFDQIAVFETSRCLDGYMIGLFPMTVVLLLAPALYSVKNFATPTKAAILSLIMNSCLNSLFIFGFKLGAKSVAYATTISSFFNLILLSYALRQHLLNPKNLVYNFGKVLVCCIVACASVFIPQVLSNSIFNQIVNLSMRSAGFLALLFATAYWLKAEPILMWLKLFKRR